MDVAVGATIAAVAKKVFAILLGDKKGRKFLLYVICITLFIVSFPLLTVVGLFGWMNGDAGTIIDRNNIISNLPIEQQMQIENINTTCDTIVTVFKNKNLDVNDQRKASAIYISYLVGMENKSMFYDELSNCFMKTSVNKSVYDLVSDTFFIVIPEEDRMRLDQLYGVTSIRVE